LFLFQILRLVFVQEVYPFDSDAIPYEALAPSLVSEQEHSENEAPCQPDILDGLDRS
jgi:hypothetical protein